MSDFIVTNDKAITTKINERWWSLNYEGVQSWSKTCFRWPCIRHYGQECKSFVFDWFKWLKGHYWTIDGRLDHLKDWDKSGKCSGSN